MVGTSAPSTELSNSSCHSNGQELLSLENLRIIWGDGNGADCMEARQDLLLDDTGTSYEGHADDESSAHGHVYSSYFGGPNPSAPSSPVNIPGQNCGRVSRQGSFGVTLRDSVLGEAWQRKKELSNLRERAMSNLLGRSSSYSDKAPSTKGSILDEHAKHEIQLGRSASDSGRYGVVQITRICSRSLLDDDFEELKGFIDLGFQFDGSSLPDLEQTLPALEVYCAVTQDLEESSHCLSPASSPARSTDSMPSAPRWRAFNPGDDPEEVRGRLRHWAQAVACNARLVCS